MSRIAVRKTRARFETEATYRERHLSIELGTHSLFIREKGRRTGYTVPYDCIFETGAKIAARVAREEKLLAKKRGRA